MAERKFPKILAPRLPQNTSNVNTEHNGKPKQPYSLCNQSFRTLMSSFYCSDINLWHQLIMLGGNCAIYDCYLSRTIPGVTL